MTTVEYGYLVYHSEYGYLEAPYLSTVLYGDLIGFQVRRIADNIIGGNPTNDINFQVNRIADNTIGGDTTPDIRFQARRIARANPDLGFQVKLIRNNVIHFQVNKRFYNLTQLRLMWEFVSRGTLALAGNNWTATSTATGDFLAKNVNTDIVEQIWRSNGSPSSQTLTCDTGITQGVTIDTIAILNHNFTSSALIQVQGSNDNFATSPIVTFNMDNDHLNSYYIAQTPPRSFERCRYWRFIFQDSTNPDGFLQVGTILFGNSVIFTAQDNYRNPVSFGQKHFKDVIQTEGFTNVSNDRTIKKYLTLDFEKIHGLNDNYGAIAQMIEYARTSLKVLVIPTPKKAKRFSVFAKLTQLPSESTEYIDEETEYVTLSLEFDESL